MPLTKPLSEVKEEIRAFVGESEPMKALQYLYDLLPDSSGKRTQTTMNQGRLSNVNQKFNTGQIKFEDYNLHLQQINAAILEVVEELTEVDFQATGQATVAAIPKFVVIYNNLDKPYFEALQKQLKVLERFKKLSFYDVQSGDGDLEAQANAEIATADYLLVLLTPSFINEDKPIDWYDLTTKALGEGRRMIPLRIQKLADEVPELEKLKSLPSMGRWVSEMPNQDDAYAEIVGELRKLLPK